MRSSLRSIDDLLAYRTNELRLTKNKDSFEFFAFSINFLVPVFIHLERIFFFYFFLLLPFCPTALLRKRVSAPVPLPASRTRSPGFASIRNTIEFAFEEREARLASWQIVTSLGIAERVIWEHCDTVGFWKGSRKEVFLVFLFHLLFLRYLSWIDGSAAAELSSRHCKHKVFQSNGSDPELVRSNRNNRTITSLVGEPSKKQRKRQGRNWLHRTFIRSACGTFIPPIPTTRVLGVNFQSFFRPKQNTR